MNYTEKFMEPELLLLLLDYVYLLAASAMSIVILRTGVKEGAVEFNMLLRLN